MYLRDTTASRDGLMNRIKEVECTSVTSRDNKLKEMKKTGITIIAILLMGTLGCKKHHTLPRVPSPVWTVDNSGKYPVSMTAVVQVPEDLRTYLQETDKIGAFVGDECRGTGTWIHTGNVSAFFILIHGTSSEKSKIRFKYYFSWKSNLYETAPFLDFTVDGNFGSVDAPQILDLKPRK